MKQLRTQKWVTCRSIMLILVLCLALSFSGVLMGAPAVQAAETNIWTQLPLYGGSVSIILAIDPLTPTTLYVSTERGIFRSIDSGDTWTAVNTSLANQYVRSLEIDPKAPTTLYAGTSFGGASAPSTAAPLGRR